MPVLKLTTTFPNDEGYDELVLARAIPSTFLGTLRADPRSRAEFFALAGVPH